MASNLLTIEGIGEEGLAIFFTIKSQKHRGQSWNKFNFDADKLNVIVSPCPILQSQRPGCLPRFQGIGWLSALSQD